MLIKKQKKFLKVNEFFLVRKGGCCKKIVLKVESLLFIGAGAGAGACEKIYPELEPVKNGPVPQHCT